MVEKKNLPIIYSCSGCSSAAQMANAIAVRIDREGLAEMSCIVGVGGDVKPLVKTAKSGRPLWVIDGCPLTCSVHCLARHDLKPDYHFVLSKMNVPKKIHEDFDSAMAEEIFLQIKNKLEKSADRG